MRGAVRAPGSLPVCRVLPTLSLRRTVGQHEGPSNNDVHSFALVAAPLQVFREETLVEELIMDMEFSWNGDQKFQLMVSLLPACWYLWCFESGC